MRQEDRIEQELARFPVKRSSIKRTKEGKKDGVTDMDGELFSGIMGVRNDWIVGTDSVNGNSY